MTSQNYRNEGGTDSKHTVDKLLEEHQEAIAIFLDPDGDSEGEFKIGVFTKLAHDSRLSSVLEQILENLQRTRHGKSRSSPVPDKASGSPKKYRSPGPQNGNGCCTTLICENCESA